MSDGVHSARHDDDPHSNDDEDGAGVVGSRTATQVDTGGGRGGSARVEGGRRDAVGLHAAAWTGARAAALLDAAA